MLHKNFPSGLPKKLPRILFLNQGGPVWMQERTRSCLCEERYRSSRIKMVKNLKGCFKQSRGQVLETFKRRLVRIFKYSFLDVIFWFVGTIATRQNLANKSAASFFVVCYPNAFSFFFDSKNTQLLGYLWVKFQNVMSTQSSPSVPQ